MEPLRHQVQPRLPFQADRRATSGRAFSKRCARIVSSSSDWRRRTWTLRDQLHRTTNLLQPWSSLLLPHLSSNRIRTSRSYGGSTMMEARCRYTEASRPPNFCRDMETRCWIFHRRSSRVTVTLQTSSTMRSRRQGQFATRCARIASSSSDWGRMRTWRWFSWLQRKICLLHRPLRPHPNVRTRTNRYCGGSTMTGTRCPSTVASLPPSCCRGMGTRCWPLRPTPKRLRPL
mmetsp:Transcript_47680/g.118088  ORF Transcript_47680/g.118088 Transcript_47680/m.118088 type:complete len:231 (-) Transcript_47680:434-1126(-)